GALVLRNDPLTQRRVDAEEGLLDGVLGLLGGAQAPAAEAEQLRSVLLVEPRRLVPGGRDARRHRCHCDRSYRRRRKRRPYAARCAALASSARTRTTSPTTTRAGGSSPAAAVASSPSGATTSRCASAVPLAIAAAGVPGCLPAAMR